MNMPKLVRTLVSLPMFGIASGAGAVLLPVGMAAPASAASVSKIGDLSFYRAAVVDTAATVDKGDLAGACKASLADLLAAMDRAGGTA